MPYLAMGVTVTLASLLDAKQGIVAVLWAAAATFGASYGLLPAADVGASERLAIPAERLDLPRDPAWIAGGVAAALVLFVVLGPGVSR